MSCSCEEGDEPPQRTNDFMMEYCADVICAHCGCQVVQCANDSAQVIESVLQGHFGPFGHCDHLYGVIRVLRNQPRAVVLQICTDLTRERWLANQRRANLVCQNRAAK